ncbi:hypothetical protein F0L68_11135 [Solihabitans fulvus]|uniref:Uncharacterized protein n=1 Tax=Solihabitans fulvus TaxID=1892852 RepID=A0A5B2XJ07_9PSEU|nr:hypothetical protein [Solihabitans fulvus]KAA2263005.1 hypothetical protein F0L68_11135 [Solihabitans fulvus]
MTERTSRAFDGTTLSPGGDPRVFPAQRMANPLESGAERDVVSVVERYKEIAGMAAESVDRMRRHDQERASVLDRALLESQERMARIADQERIVRLGVALHWEAAVEALWDERWMTMSPQPQPDETVPDHDQLHFDGEIERTYRALEDALQKRGLIRRKRD